jgi:hypothetical protein
MVRVMFNHSASGLDVSEVSLTPVWLVLWGGVNTSMFASNSEAKWLLLTFRSVGGRLLRRLGQYGHGTAALLTHDMGVVADIADEVVVMSAGRIAPRVRRRPHPSPRQAVT